MLRRARLAALVLLCVPAFAAAVESCPDCVLGLYDDTSLSSNFGVSVPLTMKDIYLAIDLAAPETGVTGIEFSIAGITGTPLLVLGVTPLVPTPVTLGSPPAPADTSATSTGTGGMDIAWQVCQTGDRALVKLTVFHINPVVNQVLRVMHKFPQSNTDYRLHPVFTRCDSPTYTSVRINGGCYVLNPNGEPTPSCPVGTVAVNSSTWSSVKQLFR